MRSGNARLVGYTVSLYASFVDRADAWQFLGSSVSDANDDFQIFYAPTSERSVLIVQADRGPVTLASAIGYGDDPPVPGVDRRRNDGRPPLAITDDL